MSIPVMNQELDAIIATLTQFKNSVQGIGIARKSRGSIVSFNDSIGGFNLNRLVANLAPIQTGEGDPSPTNIRPIYGHTEVEVARTGKNLWGNGDVPKNDTANYKKIPLVVRLKPGTYMLSLKATSSSGNIRLSFRNSERAIANKNVVADGTRKSGTFTLTEMATVVYFYGSTTTSECIAASISDDQI